MSWNSGSSMQQPSSPQLDPHEELDGNGGIVDLKLSTSRRAVLTAAAGALAALGGGTVSATREAERRKDRNKDRQPNRAESGPVQIADRRGSETGSRIRGSEGSKSLPSATAPVSKAFSGTQLGGTPVYRIDTWGTVGQIWVYRTSRQDKGSTWLDNLQIHIYDTLADRLNPGTEVWVRPADGMVWNGKKTYINRGAAGTWASFPYTVTIGKNQLYEIWLEPFIEDVRTSTSAWISQNEGFYILV